MKKLLFGILAAWATVSSAETVAHWTFGEKGLADVSGNGHALAAANVEFGETFKAGTLSVGREALKNGISSVRVTTGVVPPDEFMTERKVSGLSILVR